MEGDTAQIGAMAAFAPVLPFIIYALRLAWTLDDRYVPLLALALTAAYGLVIWLTLPISFTVPELIISVVLVASSASGLQQWTKTVRANGHS